MAFQLSVFCGDHSLLVLVCVSLMMCKDACMEMWICDRRDWVWDAPVIVRLCVWLCAQTCWLVADNNTRGRVFVDFLLRRFPPCSACLGSVCFSGLHAWLRQLFYSPVGLFNPTRPSSLTDPSFPQRPALHLIRVALAKPSAELLRAPQSCSMLTMHPPPRPHSLHLHVKTLGLISSSLELWHNSQ